MLYKVLSAPLTETESLGIAVAQKKLNELYLALTGAAPTAGDHLSYTLNQLISNESNPKQLVSNLKEQYKKLLSQLIKNPPTLRTLDIIAKMVAIHTTAKLLKLTIAPIFAPKLLAPIDHHKTKEGITKYDRLVQLASALQIEAEEANTEKAATILEILNHQLQKACDKKDWLKRSGDGTTLIWMAGKHLSGHQVEHASTNTYELKPGVKFNISFLSVITPEGPLKLIFPGIKSIPKIGSTLTAETVLAELNPRNFCDAVFSTIKANDNLPKVLSKLLESMQLLSSTSETSATLEALIDADDLAAIKTQIEELIPKTAQNADASIDVAPMREAEAAPAEGAEPKLLNKEDLLTGLGAKREKAQDKRINHRGQTVNVKAGAPELFARFIPSSKIKKATLTTQVLESIFPGLPYNTPSLNKCVLNEIPRYINDGSTTDKINAMKAFYEKESEFNKAVNDAFHKHGIKGEKSYDGYTEEHIFIRSVVHQLRLKFYTECSKSATQDNSILVIKNLFEPCGTDGKKFNLQANKAKKLLNGEQMDGITQKLATYYKTKEKFLEAVNTNLEKNNMTDPTYQPANKLKMFLTTLANRIFK